MKTNKIILIACLVAISSAMSLSSCKKRTKKQAEEPDREANTARDNARVENVNSDIDFMGSQLSETGNLSTYKTSGNQGLTDILSIAPCATVTGYGTSTITVDFGTSGCDGQDKRKRTGKLIFDLSGSTPSTSVNYRNPGFKMKVSSLNYMVDSMLVEIINKEITNTTPASIGTGTNTGGVNLTWSVTANIKVTKPNSGGTITWVCNRTKELVNTMSPPYCYNGQLLAIDWTKAIVKINGNASGTNAKGENYTVTATNLIRDFNCSPSSLQPKRHPFVEGKLDYKPGSRPTRYFDFGKKEDCDFNATVTINGVTYAITLP